MKAIEKLKQGDRVQIISGENAGNFGVVMFNKGKSWYICIEGETRPANIVGAKNYYSVFYKSNLIKKP